MKEFELVDQNDSDDLSTNQSNGESVKFTITNKSQVKSKPKSI